MTENKLKPEVEIEIGGEIKTVVFNHYSLLAIEETEGANFIGEAATEISKNRLGLRNLIVLLWGGLLTKQTDLDVRKEDDLRAARRQVALWLTDARVKDTATVAVITALANSLVLPKKAEKEDSSSKKVEPSLETGSEK